MPEAEARMRNALTMLLVSVLLPAFLFAQPSDRWELVERYTKELRSRDVWERVEAAESLGNLGMAEAVPPLMDALFDREPAVREAAASALWVSSEVAEPALPALRKALNDPEPAVVVRAAGALLAMGEPASSLAVALRFSLKEGDETDRFLAARALIGTDPADRLVHPILDYMLLNTPDPEPQSDSFMRSDNFDSGKRALRELAATQDRKVIAPLLDRLRESPYLTQPVLVALGELSPRPDRWIETLLGLLTFPKPEARETAIELLAREQTAADVKIWAKPVSRLVTDAEREVRYSAIRALQNARGLAIEAIGPVVQAVRAESDVEVRAQAADAVGEIGDAAFAIDTAVKAAAAKEALPVLTAAIEKDASVEVRTKALRSLNKLELDPATVAEILARAAVEQKDRSVRVAALQALRNRGRDAATAEAKIAPLKNDGDELIRRMTEGALESMRSDRGITRTLTTTAAADPAARDKALEVLREGRHPFTEDEYFSALNKVELELVEAFLDAGMSPNHRFARLFGDPALRVVLEGDEACHVTVRPTAAGTKAIVKLLIARGADPNIADDRGNTPLMKAVEHCDVEVVKMLLAAKADMNAKNITDTTAFEFGLQNESDGAEALATAGFRLSEERVKIYRTAYAQEPKKLALLKKATRGGK
jgi:HEAT repeat protein